MTEGCFYIPLGKKGNFLACNAAHDADIEGLGFALLSSSHVMQEIIQINTAFAGSLTFFNLDTQLIDWYHDYMIDIFDNCENEEIKESGLLALDLVKEGELNLAKETLWWNLSLEEKEEALGFTGVLNNEVGIIEKKNFLFTDEAQIKKLYQVLFHTHENYSLITHNYAWHNGQVYYECRDKSDISKNYSIPLVAYVFFQLASWAGPFELSGSYADVEDYFNSNITQKDIKTLSSLIEYNKKEKLLLPSDVLQPLIDKIELEKQITPTSPKAALTHLKI